MNLNNSFKLATAMVNNGPFQRFVWSVVTENKISFHPDEINKPFDGQLFVKVERQITIPFPEIQAGLFILRQNILLPEEIDYTALRNACAGMTDAQREYKGISGEMMDWLIFVPRGETAIIIRS